MVRRCVQIVLAIAANLALSCCASQPLPTVDPLGAAPPDFTLDVTVLTNPAPQATMSPTESAMSIPVPAQLRPSRFVVFPDGSLHYAPDPDHRGAGWLPPISRILNRPQIAEVWSLSQHAGLTNPSFGSEPVNFDLITATVGEIVFLMAFEGFERSWCFIRRGPNGQAPDAAMARLIRYLDQLAWASDQPENELETMPIRYDFGPDPYARYRSPTK